MRSASAASPVNLIRPAYAEASAGHLLLNQEKGRGVHSGESPSRPT
jgi:hypothetical protein